MLYPVLPVDAKAKEYAQTGKGEKERWTDPEEVRKERVDRWRQDAEMEKKGDGRDSILNEVVVLETHYELVLIAALLDVYVQALM